MDECHRGSAKEDSNWREILEYFQPAYQLGMTATPLRDENRDTYLYFGNPIYTYSLKQGIDDGFLAPYRVHRMGEGLGVRAVHSPITSAASLPTKATPGAAICSGFRTSRRARP